MPNAKPKLKKSAISANPIVAHNLARGRSLRGWTQEEAAVHLENYLGVRWSKASWSAAERSVDGTRVRQFTADEIVAFSKAFGLPLAWWFLPPDVSSTEAADLLTAQLADSPELQDAYLDRLRDLYVADNFQIPRRIVFQRALEEALEMREAKDLAELRDTLRELSQALDIQLSKPGEKED